ncbi:hypothetical protein V1514DRAFT_353952 [Lipomyces japonicus]|uniref:uncharacterized protein n=1 Tax=Lipomyces japonicus TaxID=56871 RepID=UPI0034CD2EC8
MQPPFRRVHRRAASNVSSHAPSMSSSSSLFGPADSDGLIPSTTATSSSSAPAATAAMFAARQIVNSGEVIASSGLLRGKKRDFLVLTTAELLRFKSRSKAAELFPSLLGISRQLSNASSIGSIATTTTTSHATINDSVSFDYFICSLDKVTAVFELAPVLIEVSFIDNDAAPRSTVLQFASRAETEQWLSKFTATVPKRTAAHDLSPATIESIKSYLQARNDFYAPTFGAFRIVVQNNKLNQYKSSKVASSSDDLTKLANSTTHAILIIGHYAVHILAVDSKTTHASSTTPGTASSSSNGLPAHYTPLSTHGIVGLVHLAMSPRDSTFYLSFRMPLSPVRSLELASCAAKHIIQSVRSTLEHLRPCWTEYPLTMDVPEFVQDEPLVPIPANRDESQDSHSYGLNGFNMTLNAYLVAFGIPNSILKLAYEITWDDDNGLVFTLLPPRTAAITNTSRLAPISPSYTILELLAVMRALRWNEAFGGISFSTVSLDIMYNVPDHYAAIELDQTRTANDKRVSKFMKTLPILKLELQLIMLCSMSLRMLDLNGCIRTVKASPSSHDAAADHGTGVIDALMQVAKRATSNVDSFCFSNLLIDNYDFDYLVDVASSRKSHLRNLEVAHCGLYERELTILLQALEVHESTLEGLDISENPGRVSAYTLNESLYRFQYLRYLNMSKLLITSDDIPLLSAETLSNMRLKRLILDGTRLRPVSVKHLCDYLESDTSASLVQFSVQSCGLTGNELGVLLAAMAKCPVGRHPGLMVYIGDNPVGTAGFDKFTASFISLGKQVRRISMPRVEFPKEQLLCSFFQVLAMPDCMLTYLDLSFLLIPDADASAYACDLLGEVFAYNQSLRYLNLTGETSKLQVARIGHGIGRALTRLAENKVLCELHINGNELSVDGAMVLAKALMRNRALRRVHLDDNDVNLQGYTAIVNSIVDSGNNVIRHVSRPVVDMSKQLRNLRELTSKLDSEIAVLRQQHHSHHYSHNHHRRNLSSSSASTFSEKNQSPDLKIKAEARQNAAETLAVLESEWSRVFDRLDRWVSDNVSHGNDDYNDDDDGDDDQHNDDNNKARKALERLKGAGKPGLKVSAAGRVVS